MKLAPFLKDANAMNDTMIQMTLKIIPKNLTINVSTLESQFVFTPKKAFDSLSIVLRPQKKPKNIPPIWVKLSTNGVKPMITFKIMSSINQIKTFT